MLNGGFLGLFRQIDLRNKRYSYDLLSPFHVSARSRRFHATAISLPSLIATNIVLSVFIPRYCPLRSIALMDYNLTPSIPSLHFMFIKYKNKIYVPVLFLILYIGCRKMPGKTLEACNTHRDKQTGLNKYGSKNHQFQSYETFTV